MLFKNVDMKLCGQIVNINTIQLDFKIVSHIAVQKSFTGVKVKDCKFHFDHYFWWKI